MRRSSLRSVAVTLALCAMVLRALLPVGWMPNHGAGALSSPLMICSAQTMGAAAGIASGKGAPGDSDHERSNAPCAFAAAAHLSTPGTLSLAVSEPAQSGFIDRVFEHERVEGAPPIRLNGARGPPTLL